MSAANALDSGRAPSGNRLAAVLSRFGELQHWPVYRRRRPVRDRRRPLRRSSPRDRAALALAGGIVVWLAIEIAFGLHGWPALGRYMFEPAAIATVLAGAFVGRVLTADWRGIASGAGWRAIRSSSAGRSLAFFADPSGHKTPSFATARRARSARGSRVGPVGSARGSPGRSVPAPRAAGARLGGALLVAALVAAMVPAAVSAVRSERSDLTHQHARTAEIEALPGVIDRLGGAGRLRGCGEPLTRLQYQTALAYALGDNVSQVGFKYSEALAHGNPVLFITPFESGVGWQVQAAHQTAPACATLPTSAADF